MDIILQEKIANLGDLGDKVSVKPGFGRNFLIPKGKAIPATPEKIAEFEQRRAELEKKAAAVLDTAKSRADAIGKLDVSIVQKAGDEGKLFGSVGTADIAAAVTQAGVEIQKQEVRMPDGVIRHIGEHNIDLQIHSDVVTTITVKIVAEE